MKNIVRNSPNQNHCNKTVNATLSAAWLQVGAMNFSSISWPGAHKGLPRLIITHSKFQLLNFQKAQPKRQAEETQRASVVKTSELYQNGECN